jgi:hypothetical protein
MRTRHKLATSFLVQKEKAADFYGLQRVANLWQERIESAIFFRIIVVIDR